MLQRAADKSGRPAQQQHLITGKMTGTVCGAETDSSFVQLWADFVSRKCSVAAATFSPLAFYAQIFEQLPSHMHVCALQPVTQ